MGFSIYSLLKATLLFLNALAVLHEKRFLAKSEWRGCLGAWLCPAAPPRGGRVRDSQTAVPPSPPPSQSAGRLTPSRLAAPRSNHSSWASSTPCTTREVRGGRGLAAVV